MPAWASLTSSRTPRSPRSLSDRNASPHVCSLSLSATRQSSTSRRPRSWRARTPPPPLSSLPLPPPRQSSPSRRPSAVGREPHHRQHALADHPAVHPHLLVPGVDHQVRPRGVVQPPAPERRQLLV